MQELVIVRIHITAAVSRLSSVLLAYPLSNVHDVHHVHGRLVGICEVDGDAWAITAVSEEKVSHLSRVVVWVLRASACCSAALTIQAR